MDRKRSSTCDTEAKNFVDSVIVCQVTLVAI